MLDEKELFKNKIYNRSLVILPIFEDKIFFIYNGKIFIKIRVTKEMIGHKFGEFSFSRKKPIFRSKKKKKK